MVICRKQIICVGRRFLGGMLNCTIEAQCRFDFLWLWTLVLFKNAFDLAKRGVIEKLGPIFDRDGQPRRRARLFRKEHHVVCSSKKLPKPKENETTNSSPLRTSLLAILISQWFVWLREETGPASTKCFPTPPNRAASPGKRSF